MSKPNIHRRGFLKIDTPEYVPPIRDAVQPHKLVLACFVRAVKDDGVGRDELQRVEHHRRFACGGVDVKVKREIGVDVLAIPLTFPRVHTMFRMER